MNDYTEMQKDLFEEARKVANDKPDQVRAIVLGAAGLGVNLSFDQLLSAEGKKIAEALFGADSEQKLRAALAQHDQQAQAQSPSAATESTPAGSESDGVRSGLTLEKFREWLREKVQNLLGQRSEHTRGPVESLASMTPAALTGMAATPVCTANGTQPSACTS